MKHSHLTRASVSLLAVCAMALAACGDDDPAGTATSTSLTSEAVTESAELTESEAMTESAAAQGAADLAFSATTLDGASFEGASLAGKPALLWFWAPWCPTCAGQAEHMGEIADQYGDDISVVGVGGLDQEAAMQVFVEERGVDNFVHLSDEAGVVWQRFGITAQSTYVVLDADGTVVAEGSLSEAELDAALAGVAA